MDQVRMDAFAKLMLLRNAIESIAPDEEELTQIDGMLDRLRSRPYVLAVVGEFNRGKSSLINALLGMPVLPADVTPTTATINRVVYSDVPYVRLHMYSGAIEEVALDSLAERVTKLSVDSEAASAQVREAVIGYPTVFCRGNISILDTPGLNDSADMDALTFERSRGADAVIFALHARSPFSISEAQAVCRLLQGSSIRHILFTVGFMDTVDSEDRERLLERIVERIHKLPAKLLAKDDEISEEEKQRCLSIISESAVLGISARQALQAFVTGSQEEMESSGVELYKKELMARLTAQQDEWVQYEIVPYLERIGSVFAQASGRVMVRAEHRIQAGSEAMKRAQAGMQKLAVCAERSVEIWMEAVRTELGLQESCVDTLKSVILQSVGKSAGESEANSTAEQGAGILKWVKKKAIDAGVYRDADDPQAKALEAGFARAKHMVLRAWVPAVNKASIEGAATAASALNAQWDRVCQALDEAGEALMDEPLQAVGCGPEPAQIDAIVIRAAQMTGELEMPVGSTVSMGTVEFAAAQLARMLVGKLYAPFNRRMEVLKLSLKPRLEEMQMLYTGFEGKLGQGLEEAEKRRIALRREVDSMRKLFGDDDVPQPDAAQTTSETEPQQKEDSCGNDEL